MSTHPNVVLMARLTPDGLSRKTMRDILATQNLEDDADILIGGKNYPHDVMESDYLEGYQLSAKEGDLVFFDLVTYGYGEVISWDELQMQNDSLEKWAKETCEKFHCSYEIVVTANYW
jgi:hypothetical protein